MDERKRDRKERKQEAERTDEWRKRVSRHRQCSQSDQCVMLEAAAAAALNAETSSIVS